jgi:hypothetical protein
MPGIARTLRGFAHRLAAGAGLLSVLVAAAAAQEPMAPAPPVRETLVQLLQHADPVVRGEAALAIAPSQRSEDLDALLAVARDPNPAARVRGLLALGIHGSSGAEILLGKALKDGPHHGLERIAAAYALGLLPGRRALPSLLDYWRDATGGSLRRHRETLAALLAGIAAFPHPDQVMVIRNLLFDASNREPGLHALALEALAQIDGSLDADELARLCRSSLAEDRAGALRWMHARGFVATAKERERIVQLAGRDPSAAVRAAALDLLTRDRAIEALELGTRALAADDLLEARAGMNAILKLGGGAAREALGRRLLGGAMAPRVRSALLAGFPALEDAALLERCLLLATDRDADAGVRVEAAALAARSGEPRAAPVLRGLFTAADAPDAVATIVRAAFQLDQTAGTHEHERLVEATYPLRSSDDARLLGVRCQGLLAAGHAGALPLLERLLAKAALPAPALAELLRAHRRTAHAPAPARLAHLPAELRSLLD